MNDYLRIDRFVESAIYQFANWIAACSWQGKERDCVNIFASRFILPAINSTAAITDYSQVRIECGVPQPTGDAFIRPSAAKDFVIWRDPLEVAWDSEWQPKNVPWVVIEWKTRRHGTYDSMFDSNDLKWLTAFTEQNTTAFGYAVTVDFRDSLRDVNFARFKNGSMKINRRLVKQTVANKARLENRP